MISHVWYSHVFFPMGKLRFPHFGWFPPEKLHWLTLYGLPSDVLQCIGTRILLCCRATPRQKFLDRWRRQLLRQHAVELLENVVQIQPHFIVEEWGILCGVTSCDCVHSCPVIIQSLRESQPFCTIHFPTRLRDELEGVPVDIRRQWYIPQPCHWCPRQACTGTSPHDLCSFMGTWSLASRCYVRWPEGIFMFLVG